MVKIDLNKPMLDLDGKAMEGGTLGEILASYLVGQSQGEALKYYDWAVTLHKGKEIIVDKADFKKIKEFIENSKSLFVLSKAQMLIIMDQCEKTSAE